MGCAVSGVNRAKMSLFGRHSNRNHNNSRAILERKLYIAKESREPEFDLSECELRQVPSGTYSICKVYRKDYLYLNDNNLQSLEEGGQISDLFLIKVLNISSNKFSHIPNGLRYLVNLTELYVNNNSLTYIPESIQYLKSLKIFDVSGNNLKSLTPSMEKLKNLRKLKITNNKNLFVLCPELCLATNIIVVELDGEQFNFPPSEVATQGTTEIMKFLCNHLKIEYRPPSSPDDSEIVSVQTPSSIQSPFDKNYSLSWEEHEATSIAQENRIHQASKEQREKFLSKVLQEQIELDSEIAKVQEAKDIERQKLILSIQEDEKEIECLVKNFIQSDNLNPEIIQQQLSHEQAEHDRLLEITRQNYDNVRKTDVLKAMEQLVNEEYYIQHSKKNYDDSMNNMKQTLLMEDLDGTEKLNKFLRVKDQSRTVLVQQFLEDQDIQKAIVASLLERVDARSWSLNQEISLISSHLARLSVIEQEKKKLHIAYNYNELLHQRVQLLNLLDDLFDQQNKRRKQLISTMREIEDETDKPTDFWLKNYQKLIDSAPKTLLDISKSLDPLLANYLLQEGVIHCLPFLVKFLFSNDPLINVTTEMLKENGVSLSADRKRILNAIQSYVMTKSENHNFVVSTVEPTTPPKVELDAEETKFTGVVSSEDADSTTLDSECVICMDSKCEVVFVPCGHMCCCQSCANKEMDNCPMCRGSIERIIKVMIA